eukprot:CAMPEP_0114680078 /NCGR_PEP_ID=MMETSP0191-20121206/53666_1 /TAXON_ID=126664 /ORGANISM="Sorites sp." /LENGTH=153 /DNA_ID=CAMNT_0001956297 /DNA_START=718 /DNA_END=1175 /DNA_ORIENTATION=+
MVSNGFYSAINEDPLPGNNPRKVFKALRSNNLTLFAPHIPLSHSVSYQSQLSYMDAVILCEEEGLKIASLCDVKETKAAGIAMKHEKCQSAWFGMDFITKVDGDVPSFKWVDGTDINECNYNGFDYGEYGRNGPNVLDDPNEVAVAYMEVFFG